MGLVDSILGLVSIIESIRNRLFYEKINQKLIQKNFPLLIPHIINSIYADEDGRYPRFKGQRKTHYIIRNDGDVSPRYWILIVLKKDEKDWKSLPRITFSTDRRGTEIEERGNSGRFVPSILRNNPAYDLFSGETVCVVEYIDKMNNKYCTCQSFVNGIPNGMYINTEEEKRRAEWLKKRVNKETHKCKNCKYNTTLKTTEGNFKWLESTSGFC